MVKRFALICRKIVFIPQWNRNENAFGAYSYTAVGTEMQHFDDLAIAIRNKVFFAGEHTHIDYYSTVHGAYLSSIREADKIIALQ
jgi:monoamine oxidase